MGLRADTAADVRDRREKKVSPWFFIVVGAVFVLLGLVDLFVGSGGSDWGPLAMGTVWFFAGIARLVWDRRQERRQ